MKRATIHTLFLLCTLILTGLLIWQAWQLRQQQQLAAVLSDVPATLNDQSEFTPPPRLARHPQVVLGMANAYSAGGNLELAERNLNQLIRDFQNEPLGIAARFNLGNAYLQQALRESTPQNQKRPLLELAKQRYRDALLKDPSHWPTRYNLERVLRLAPELLGNRSEERIDPVKRVQVIVPGFEKKDLP